MSNHYLVIPTELIIGLTMKWWCDQCGCGKVLDRLDVDENQWLEMTFNFEECFSSFVGGERSLRIT